MSESSNNDDPSDRASTGERAEDLAAYAVVEVFGENLVQQHTPGDKPQGADIVTVEGVWEAKGTAVGRDYAANTPNNVNERQGSAAWVDKVTSGEEMYVNAEAVGNLEDQVPMSLIDVDFSGGTIATYDLDLEGRRTSNIPNEILSVEDLEEAMYEQSPELVNVEHDAFELSGIEDISPDLAEMQLGADAVDVVDLHEVQDLAADDGLDAVGEKY